MFSTLGKLFSFKKEPKTPLGFCDGPSVGKGSLSCCDCRTEDRYAQPYDPENKFHEAVCEGRSKVVMRLLSKKQFHVNDKDQRNRTALHFACFYGHLHLVNFLLHNKCNVNALDDQKCTPLMKAVQSWETKIVSVLLDNEADPNIKDSKGETALHQAVYVNRLEIATIATSLLEFGGNIEETTKDGFTPLLLALRERKLLMAKHLINHGANIYACDDFQRTTLMYAVKWDSEDIVELLLKKGMDHSTKDAFGWSSMQYAVAGKRKVESIILKYEDWLISSQQSDVTVTENQPEYTSPSRHYFKSESLISICSRIENKASFATQSVFDPNPLEEASRKADQSCRNDTGKSEINQVWAYKCLHPELRDYVHQISKPKSEPHQFQPGTGIEDQKQTSQEEQKQYSGGKIK